MSYKLIGSAAVITNSDGHILLVKHSYGKNNWDLPGGKAEANESAQETVIREILEEIGLQVEVGQLTGIYYDPEYDMHHFVFLSKHISNNHPKPNSPEIIECRYCSIDDLPKPISDFTIKRIQDALIYNKEPQFHIVGPRQWSD